MKYKVFLTFIFTIVAFLANAQRHSLSVSAAPAHTRLRLFDIYHNLFDLSDYLEWVSKIAPPTKPYYGYELGAYYGYQINKKTTINIGFLKSVQQLRSGLFYDNRWGSPPINYGGEEYIVTMKGYEIPIQSSFLHLQKNKLSTHFRTGIGLHIFSTYEAQSYLVEKMSGIKRKSCCYSAKRQNLKLKYILKDYTIWRYSLGLGYTFQYNLHKHLSIQTTPQFKYLSNSLEESDNLAEIKADAFITGVDFQLNFKF